jgi:hypothetical protein
MGELVDPKQETNLTTPDPRKAWKKQKIPHLIAEKSNRPMAGDTKQLRQPIHHQTGKEGISSPNQKKMPRLCFSPTGPANLLKHEHRPKKWAEQPIQD